MKTTRLNNDSSKYIYMNPNSCFDLCFLFGHSFLNHKIHVHLQQTGAIGFRCLCYGYEVQVCVVFDARCNVLPFVNVVDELLSYDIQLKCSDSFRDSWRFKLGMEWPVFAQIRQFRAHWRRCSDVDAVPCHLVESLPVVVTSSGTYSTTVLALPVARWPPPPTLQPDKSERACRPVSCKPSNLSLL